ncbi:MAG: tRNA pseudouridine(38-40) synthase TruA [Desulfobulbaceae bacterium]
MQRNIRLLVAWDGTAYSGWQRQANAVTIQGVIEDRLTVMTGAATVLIGAGRTDAGVHALGMTANFHTTAAIPCDGFLRGLNSMLPEDIRLLAVDEAEKNFHSRYNATGKTYFYRFCTGKTQLPTERLYAAHFPGSFDHEAVASALAAIRGTHDFSSFEASGSRDRGDTSGRGAVRTIHRAVLQPDPVFRESYRIILTGDGFLRHMVRNLAGTLIQVGTGLTTPEEFRAILEQRDRNEAGPTAPARGLFLEKVHYGPLDTEA